MSDIDRLPARGIVVDARWCGRGGAFSVGPPPAPSLPAVKRSIGSTGMDANQVVESTELSALLGSHGTTRPRIVVRNDRPETTERGRATAEEPRCDDVRQLAVVVWARTKLLERLLAAEVTTDGRVLAGLAEIDAAIAAICERLDRLEDALPRRAA